VPFVHATACNFEEACVSFRKSLIAGSIVTVIMAGALAACGGDKPSGQTPSGGTLTVWLMNGSAPDALVKQLNTEFEAAHAGWHVNYQVQQWNGIQDKLTTGLASNDPPDIVELGNTQAPKFVKAGALADLSSSKSALAGDKWLAGLAATGIGDGKPFATPFYGANRIVIYRKDLFQKAGITATPTSITELIDAGKKLQTVSKDSKFQALYLPGQSWYTLLSFIWAHGGDVAVKDGNTWKGALDTPQAQAGFTDYLNLFKTLSKAPADADEATPQQATVFAQGKVGMFIGLPWEIGTATDAKDGNPDLKDKIGTFPIPSSAGGPAPVFLGGSNLAISAGSKNSKAAQDWLALMLSDKYQRMLASNGVVPGITGLGDSIYGDNEAAKVMAAAAAAGGKVTPPDPAWAAVEAGTNPIKDAMTAVLRGQDIAAVTKQASEAITTRMASGG
jgi:N,N'-diacetylchitobiose transport system substrate-binding protein